MNQHFKYTLLVAAILPAVAVFTGDAMAQAQPPGIGEALRQLPPPPATRPEPALPKLGTAAAEPVLQRRAGAQIAVKKVVVEGNAAIDSSQLQALVRDGEGRSLTLADIDALARKITQHYRSQGYFVARAYLPAQEVKDGIVTIRVVEGRYGKFVLQNNSLVRDKTLLGLLDNAGQAGVVSVRTLERAMLNINDTPGVVITRADVMPGEQVGSSDFVVTTVAGPRANGYAVADNYGSEYTGKNRVAGGVDINSPFGVGDKLSASGLLSEGSYLKNYRLAYSSLLADNGLRGEVAVSRTDYQLVGTYAALDAVGTAESVEATLSYPFIRTQAYTLEGSLNAAHRKLRDELRSTDTTTPKDADVVTASLASRSEDALWGMPARTTSQVAITFGHLDIREAGARAQDALGPDTQGRYAKLNLSVSRSTQLHRNWTLVTGLRLQHALLGKNLDGSEDMSISGTSGVKAYPSGELAAENAALLDVAVEYAVPLTGPVRVKLTVFADAGRAGMQNPVANAASRTLSDVGIGASLGYSRYFATLQIARRTSGAPTSESTPENRALLQVGTSF